MLHRKLSPEENLLLNHFSEEELEHLTPGELRLLAALDHEELPEVPAVEQQRAKDKYRAHVNKKIARTAKHEQLTPKRASSTKHNELTQEEAAVEAPVWQDITVLGHGH